MASPVKVVRIFLKILSTIAGIFFLCKSSFSQLQIGEDGNLKTFVIAVLSALVVTSIFVVPMLRTEWTVEGQGVAASFCVALIFFGGYADSLRGNPGGQEARNSFVQYTKVLELPFAIAAIISLSLCSFSKLQFQNSANLEVACIGVFSLLLGACMKKLPGWIDKMVKACSNPLVVAALNSLLLLITSVLIFLNKFPRFNIHSKYREFCTEKEEKSINHGSRFDPCSLGAFALLASLISSEQPYDGRQSFESGIFSFLLELTMDASVETLENKMPSIRYMMFAFMYCVGLIFLKACFPPDQQNDGAGGGGGGGGRGEGPDDDLEAQHHPTEGRDDRNGGRDADGNGGGDGGNGGGDNDGNGGGDDRNSGGDDNDRGEADGRVRDANGRDGRTGAQSGVSSGYPQAGEDWDMVPEHDGGGRREEQGHDIGESDFNIQSPFAPRHEMETMLPRDETSSSATGLRRRISATTFVGESPSGRVSPDDLIAPQGRRPPAQRPRPQDLGRQRPQDLSAQRPPAQTQGRRPPAQKPQDLSAPQGRRPPWDLMAPLVPGPQELMGPAYPARRPREEELDPWN